MMPRRVLVTGGSGFLGSALVRRLVHEGADVRVLDNHSRGAVRRLGDVIADVELVEADIRDAARVRTAMRGVDTVVHMAYVNGTEFFYSHPELVLDVGIRGMLAVLDGCRAESVGDLVLVSSSEVYQLPAHIPTDESVPLTVPDVLNPRYSYGGGKIACELMAVNYGRTGFDRVAIVRPHNVYGPDMGWEHVLPQFILRAVDAVAATAEGAVSFPIQGDGTETRAFTHIDDFTDGLMLVLGKGEHHGIYHIGNPEELAIGDVARRVVAHFGRDASILTGTRLPGSASRRCPDIGRMQALGFAPRISFDGGLPGIAEWYAANAGSRPAPEQRAT
jgi:nucleoside-diphosphate-sugar epimerase